MVGTNETIGSMDMTLTEARDAYIRKYGRIHEAADRKIEAFHILSNGTMTCGYCGCALMGDKDAAFEHMDGDGNVWRKQMETRDELRMINNGTHPSANRRKFVCVPCNTAKGKMSYAAWMQSPEYRGRVIRERIYQENEARIAAFIATGEE